MPGLTIRNLDPAVKKGLRMQAARHACSMEEEARRILRAAILQPVKEKGLGSFIQQKFKKIGGVEIDTVRSAPRSPDLQGDEE
jgi:plasmid stability protein